MVIREDFIMRQVEQFFKALAKILLNKKEQTESEFYDQLNSLTLHTVGLDLKSLKEMPVSDLFRLFSISGKTDATKCYTGAVILLKECGLSGGAAADMRYDYDLLLRSFLLYHKSVETDRRYLDENYLSEFLNPILSLKKCMPEPEIKFNLFHFFEIAGYYSDAEDLLFELADDNYDNIKNIGEEFFYNLKDKPEAALRNGNLPPEEIEEGLRQFRERV